MTETISISGLAVASMLTLALTEHRIHPKHLSARIFWLAPLGGALLLLLLGILTPAQVWAGLTQDTAVNPVKILVLFFAMTLMSVFLDEEGFFRHVAGLVLARAGGSQSRLFGALYLVVSVLTLFTSNDIVVLTFTPFICYFAKHAKIDPLPYLICEFVAANTWSMGLVIGNPTNIYLAGSAGVGFAEYLGVMLLPTLLAGGASFLVLRVLFAARLRAGVTGTDEVEQIADKPTVVLGLASLGGCIALMVLSSYVNLPMWLIAAVCCAFLYVAATGELAARHRTLAPVGHSLLRAPFDVIPFVLSMFVLVQGLQETGVTELLATHLLGTGEIFKTGVASFLAANLVNNIPMSVLFSAVVAPGGVASLPALYAAVIGSNVGAFFTPMGALAGIMWMAMLRTQGVRLSFGKFMAYGAVVAIPTLLAALAGLAIVL